MELFSFGKLIRAIPKIRLFSVVRVIEHWIGGGVLVGFRWRVGLR